MGAGAARRRGKQANKKATSESAKSSPWSIQNSPSPPSFGMSIMAQIVSRAAC